MSIANYPRLAGAFLLPIMLTASTLPVYARPWHDHGGHYGHYDRGHDHGGGSVIGGVLLGLGIGAVAGVAIAQQNAAPPPGAYYPPPPPAAYAPPPGAYYPN